MKVFMGADHRGYKLKEKLKRWLAAHHPDSIRNRTSSVHGLEVVDCGAKEEIPKDDYVEYAMKVALQVKSHPSADGSKVKSKEPAAHFEVDDARGIVICGTGVGVDVAVNKVKGIRCGLGINPEQVKAARHDDDINVLALAADYIGEEGAKRMVEVFLETEFGGEERYVRRIKKVEELDR